MPGAKQSQWRKESNHHGKELEFMVEHLRRSFPLVMSKSRGRQNIVHGFCSINSGDTLADIHEHGHTQIHTQLVDNPLTRFAHIENREHICVGPEVDDRQMLERLAHDGKHTVKKHVSVGPVDDD